MLYDGLTREFQPLRGNRNKNKRIDDNFGKPSSIRAAAISIWDYVRNVCKEEDVEFIKSIATRAKNTLTGVSATVRTLMGNMAVYEREKKAQPFGIDFTDMLMEAANTPGRSLDLMIVDEAQDSSPLQWRVIEKWARLAQTVVLIGDPDQAIHEWAGASPEHFTRHIDEGYEVRKLAQSYRVPRAIHKKARKIILLNKNRIDAEYEPVDADGEVRNLNEKQVLELCKATALANKQPYSDEDEILAEMSGYELPDPIPALFILSRDRRGCSRYSNLLTDHAVPFINERGPCLHTSSAKLAVIGGIINLKRTGEIEQRELRHLLESLPVRGNKYWENPKVQVLSWLTKTVYTTEDIIKLGVRIEDLTESELMTAIHSSRMKVTAPQAEMARIMANTYGLEALSLKPNILVTTIHASKGREAETVVVSAQKPFPIQLNYNDRKRKEIEAERRTLYVACTRARKTLVIDKTGKELYGELL